MPESAEEKRKKVILTGEESRVLRWLYLKNLVPTGLAISISTVVLYFGLGFLMQKTGFANYGTAPSESVVEASRFVSIYLVIALANVFIIAVLSAVIMYLVIHDLVMPVLRVTRELKECVQLKTGNVIVVRTSDRLLKPLVDLINKLIA